MPRVYQIMDALDYGDAVSSHTINVYRLLIEMGYSTKIYSKYVHENCKEYYNNYTKMNVEKDDIVLFHFSGKSILLDFIKGLKCKKFLVYHNITPPEFFKDNKAFFEHCNEGLDQLKDAAKYFDYFIADSEFNCQDLLRIGITNAEVLPIVVDFDKIHKTSINSDIIEKYSGYKIFLFVGRVAPNKKHEDIIRIFEYYHAHINSNSKLVFVGNYEHYMDYFQYLNEIVSKTQCRGSVVFTGKVNESELYAYYSIADVFVCMSEHEGFCVPLLESMSFQIPTFAYDAGAIKTTMGDAGILIKKKQHDDIAELINIVVENVEVKNRIVQKQLERIQDYGKASVMKKINSILTR